MSSVEKIGHDRVEHSYANFSWAIVGPPIKEPAEKVAELLGGDGEISDFAGVRVGFDGLVREAARGLRCARRQPGREGVVMKTCVTCGATDAWPQGDSVTLHLHHAHDCIAELRAKVKQLKMRIDSALMSYAETQPSHEERSIRMAAALTNEEK